MPGCCIRAARPRWRRTRSAFQSRNHQHTGEIMTIMITRRAVMALAGATLALAITPAQAQWKPNKPVTIIVPWAAGGATDQVTRLAAAELEEGLGQKIVVVNQPGGSGSIGTKNTLGAPRDGYTWTAGAPKQIGTYPLLGMIDS